MRRYISVIALNCSVFVLMCGVGMIVALLPQRIIALSGSISQVGYLASAFAVSYLLVQLPIGRLADLLGFKGFLIGGVHAVCVYGSTVLFCRYIPDHIYRANAARYWGSSDMVARSGIIITPLPCGQRKNDRCL